MQKSPRIAEISTKVVGDTFYVHPVYVANSIHGGKAELRHAQDHVQ